MSKTPKAVLVARQDRMRSEHRAHSGRISEICRFIGFGLLAVYFTLRSGSGPYAEELVKQHPCLLAVVALGGAGAVLFDYLQYAFAWHSAKYALERHDSYQQNKNWISYRYGQAFFYLKQIAAFIGSVTLVGLLASAH